MITRCALSCCLAVLAVPGCDGGSSDFDAGERTDLGVDAGPSDLGVGDLGLRDLGPRDAAHDGALDLGPRDLGRDLGPIDGGRRCDLFDGGMQDLGPLPDLGPLAPPELDAALPMIPDLGPGYLLGCERLLFCTAVPGDDGGLTWDNFAQEFFVDYCNRCHSSTLPVDDAGTRHGAPPGYNWDDRAAVYLHRIEIRDAVGVTMYMPYDEPWTLPCERRRELVEWVDDGAP